MSSINWQEYAEPNAALDPKLWQGREGKRLIMSDGSKWELQDGKPVQVSAPTKK